jgi:hypothetical protein
MQVLLQAVILVAVQEDYKLEIILINQFRKFMKEIKFLHQRGDSLTQGFAPKRLLWVTEGGPKGEDVKPENKEQLEVKEKMKAEDLNKIVERVKTMSFKEKMQIDPTGKGAVEASKFRAALNKVIDSEGLEKKVGVKNLSNFLVFGLMERITGKAPDRIGGSMGGNDLTAWLKKNNVASFTIEDGNWLFFDKAGVPVQAEYKLDAPVAPGKTRDKKAEQKTEKKDKVGVSKGVDEAKKKDQVDKAKKAQESASEAERLKPENLEKVKSDKPVPLSGIKDGDDLAAKLEASVTKDGKAAITKAEILTALTAYAKAANTPGNTDQQIVDNFFNKIKPTHLFAGIEGGKIGFMEITNPTKLNTNPANLNTIVDGKPRPTELYVNDSLRQKAEGKVVETEKKVKTDAELKPTKYDATEAAVQKLLLGKEKLVEGQKMPEVNTKYLAAYEAIVNFKGGEPAEFKLTINDSPLDCKFYKGVNGQYILTYGKGPDQFAYFTPDQSSAQPLEDAKVFYAKFLNSGEMFQKIQSNNIKNKANFENLYGDKEPTKERNQLIDDGPKILADNKVKYEFDWDKGSDPDVTIEALPHGEFKVTIEKSGIAPDGGNVYEFRASGFRDMMRQLKSVQNQVEHPEQYSAEDLQMTRFFRQGKDALQASAKGGNGEASWDAGKIVNVRSGDSTVEAKAGQGTFVEFDWMDKLVPPRELQITGELGHYEYRVVPGELKLPVTEAPQTGGFLKAMKALSEWRAQETQKGGPEAVKQKVGAIIEKYNQRIKEDNNKIEMRTSVVPKAVIGETVYLSLVEGMAPVAFDFGKAGSDPLKVPGIDEAVREGYLLSGKPVESGKKVDGDKKAPDKPVERVSAGLDKFKENPAIVDRAEKETALSNILSKVKNAQVREMLKASLLARMQDLTCDKTDKKEKVKFYQDKATEFYVADSGKTLNQKVADTNKVKPADYMSKSSAELFGDKYLPDLPNTRGVLISLAFRISDLAKADGTIDIAKIDQIKKTYAGALKDATAEIMSINKIKKGEIKVAYDKRIMELVFKQVKMPEAYLAEYKINEAKKPAYEEYKKTAPPEKPADKVSAELEKEKLPIDYVDKKSAVEKISAKVTDSVTRAKIDAYLKAKLLDEQTLVNGTMLPKAHYEMRAWEILRDLTGVKGEYFVDGKENKNLQKEVLAKINDKKAAGTLFEKVDAEGMGNGSLKDQPRTKAYLNGLLESFDKASGLTDASKLKEVKVVYKDGLNDIANVYLTKTPFPTKKGQLKTDYDLGMLKSISWKIKSPADFVKEYQTNASEKEAFKKYNEKQADIKKTADDYEASKKDPNGMSFAEFEKGKMGGAAPEAWRIFGDSKAIRKENINLSRIENNNSNSDPISFNIKIGPPNELRPFTITISKNGSGRVNVDLAKGWNNRAYMNRETHNIDVSQPIPASKDPIKSIMGNVYGMDAKLTNMMESWTKDEPAKKDGAKKKDEPAKKPDEKKAA